MKATLVYKWDRIRTAFSIPASGLLKIQPDGLKHPLLLRRGKSSDMEVYRAVFIEREYDAVSLDAPRLILDLGANIGLSSVYFLNRFPSTRVVAVEPDPNNFEFCRRNLAPWGERTILVQGAVWSHPCQLEIQSYPSGEGKEWAVTVQESKSAGAATIRAWDLPSLADLASPDGGVDFLKGDIEGSERQLFSCSARAWLSRVRNICIELQIGRAHV